MEEEYIQLLIISSDDFSKEALRKATIRMGGDDEDNVTYRIDTLWWYLYQMKIPGTSRSKFYHLFKVAKLVLLIIHSNTVEESLFSCEWKSLTQYRASLSLDGSLSSIIKFQMSRPTNECVINILWVTQNWKKLEQQLWNIIKNTHVQKHCQNKIIEKIKRRSLIFIIFAMTATL